MSISRRQIFAAAAIPGVALAARKTQERHVQGIRLVALDIGGTLIEDRADIPKLLEEALSRHGVGSTPAEIAKWRGASKREIVRHFVTQQSFSTNVDREALTTQIYEEFTAKLIAVYQSVPPIRGAEDCIRQLRQNGYLVATTTGFDRAVTASIFRRLGWEHYFAAMVSSDEVSEGRPAPYMLFHAMESARVSRVSEVMTVGDTPLDLQAGANAGLRWIVGVLSGAGTAAALQKEPHSHILNSVADLPGLLPKV